MSTRALLLLSLLTVPWGAARAQEPARVSSFGRYEGFSEELFDGWTTTSRYVEMRDGVRLAVDVTRPTFEGELVEDPLPVVWTHSRYHRNPSAIAQHLGGGPPRNLSMVDSRPDLQRLVRHGYVVVAVAVRGSGASFGRYEGLFSEAETQDAAEIVAWLAGEPWCDGNVGMFGGSYLGMTQYMAASTGAPALKAIFPDVAAFDLYDLLYPGGVFRGDMIAHWDGLTRRLDTEWTAPRVDGDDDGALLAEALREHAGNWDVLANFRATPWRDRPSAGLDWSHQGPLSVLGRVQEAAVPAYHFNGWFDVFVLDSLLWFANYRGPEHLAIGPWAHAGVPDPAVGAERSRLTAIEQHRWFDRWLKGVANGVDREPPIHYAVMEEPGRWHWRSAAAWPPPEARPRTLFLADAPDEAPSHGGGRLEAARPEETSSDAYAIDLATTTGSTSRWDNAVGAAPAMVYDRLAENDARSLTYTTPPLEEDLLVVGHPVLTLFVTASAGDADLHAVLEELDERGEVRYVTEGLVRGSLRRRSEAPWNDLGLPFQRCYEEDAEPLPRPGEEPAAVVFDLLPTANVFDAGHRLRLSVFGADADNTEPPKVPAGSELVLALGGESASSLVLPVVEAD